MCRGELSCAVGGGSISTEQAFVHVAVVLVAVLFDRRALTLRAVAIAAMIVLTLRPEALFGPGLRGDARYGCGLVAALVAPRGGCCRVVLGRGPCHSAVRGVTAKQVCAVRFDREPDVCAPDGDDRYARGRSGGSIGPFRA